MKNLNIYIEKIKKISESVDLPIIISLQNTVSSSIDKMSLYFLPIRIFENYIFAGICNGNNKETRYFLKSLQNSAKYVLLDVEKKYPWKACKEDSTMYMGNIEANVKDLIDMEKVIYIWPNSMTVEACLARIINKLEKPLSLSRIAVVGIGNIGFKLALRLVEAGCKTSISSNNYEHTLQLTTLINKIKPKSTIASPIPYRENVPCVSNQDFVIISTGSSFFFDKVLAYSLKENTKILSLSNIRISDEVRKILDDKNVIFEIIDITIFYKLEVQKKESLKNISLPKRIYRDGNYIVSGGFPGKYNDLVVDNAEHPRVLLGHISKDGDYIRNIELWEDWVKSKKK